MEYIVYDYIIPLHKDMIMYEVLSKLNIKIQL